MAHSGLFIIVNNWDTPSPTALNMALNVLETQAQFDVSMVHSARSRSASPSRIPALPSGLRHGPFYATLNGLIYEGRALGLPQKTTGLPDTPTNPRPLDPARRFGSRLRYRPQPLRVRISERQLNRLPPRCIALGPSSSMPRTHRSLKRQINPSLMTTFTESIV